MIMVIEINSLFIYLRLGLAIHWTVMKLAQNAIQYIIMMVVMMIGII